MRYLEAKRAKMRRRYYEDKALRGPEADKAPEPAPVADLDAWPLKMSPKTYLALHPTGQWAELARLHLDADDGERS
jgi:hypothetical protein